MPTRFLLDDSGATAVEYAAIASFLSIVTLAGGAPIGRMLREKHFEALLQAWAKASP